MNMHHIGEVLRNRRIELGYSQEKVCAGICEPPTLSRIESGKRLPSKAHLDALMQRLGMSGTPYMYARAGEDFELESLKTEILACNTRHDSKTALEKIAQLETICKESDKITQQFILRSKMIAGTLVNGISEPYDNNVLLEMLLEAIRKTIPKFNDEDIEKSLLTYEETKLINHIAVTYYEMGNTQKALEIYRQLWKHTNKHYIPADETASIISLVGYNYSKYLGLKERYKEALEIAEAGYECCIRYEKSRLFGHILYNMAYIYNKVGRHDDSKRVIQQSYYLSQAMKYDAFCDLAQNFARTHYQIEFS